MNMNACVYAHSIIITKEIMDEHKCILSGFHVFSILNKQIKKGIQVQEGNNCVWSPRV